MYSDLRMITETLRQELTAIFVEQTDETEGADDNAEPSYVLRSEEQVEFVFYTLNPSWQCVGSMARMARVRYVFTKDAAGQGGVLRRYESLASGSKVVGKEVMDVVCDGLDGFVVSVYDEDKGEWVYNYEGTEKRPAAVKFQLQFGITEFESVFALTG